MIDLHCKVLELALQEWEQREGLGTSFTAEVQKHVCGWKRCWREGEGGGEGVGYGTSITHYLVTYVITVF